MTSTISTYEELLQEKQRLTSLLEVQKAIVREDIQEIKQELAPVKSAISVVQKFATKDQGSWLLSTAADRIIDVVLKKVILSQSGWITKMVIPFLMKNFSSHVISDNKDAILGKLFSWIGKKNANGKVHKVAEEEEEED